MSEMENGSRKPEEKKELLPEKQEVTKSNEMEISYEEQALIENEEIDKEKSADDIIEEIQHRMASESEKADDKKEAIAIDTEAWKNFSLQDLTREFKDLMDQYPVEKIKPYLYKLRDLFKEKYREARELALEKYVEANDTEEGFVFQTPERENFDLLYREFRRRLEDAREQYRKQLEENLLKKEAILEELKKLATGQLSGNASELFRKFKDLKKAWHEVGNVARDKYLHLWRNWKHWEEQFFDLLHLDREYREKLFEENLKQKQKIVERAKELLEKEDVIAAYRELQFLHKVWKEETGPVAPEYREKIWQEFKELTKQMHDKRNAYLARLKEVYEANYEKKKELLGQMRDLLEMEITNHDDFKEISTRMDELRQAYLETGFVPLRKRDEIRSEFREIQRAYSKKKNRYFKSMKALQKENLQKKKALIEEVKKLKEQEDIKEAHARCKQIREEWNQIGFVPRKDSQTIWEEFRAACKEFYDFYYENLKKEQEEEYQVYLQKKAYLQELKKQFKEEETAEELSLEKIEELKEKWHAMGQVPDNLRFINVKFNKFLQSLYRKLNIDEDELRLMKYKSMLEQWVESGETGKIFNERRFVRNKIEELEREIQNAERNLEFFHSSDKNNPILRQMEKKLEKERKFLDLWKKKLALINQLKF